MIQDVFVAALYIFIHSSADAPSVMFSLITVTPGEEAAVSCTQSVALKFRDIALKEAAAGVSVSVHSMAHSASCEGFLTLTSSNASAEAANRETCA